MNGKEMISNSVFWDIFYDTLEWFFLTQRCKIAKKQIQDQCARRIGRRKRSVLGVSQHKTRKFKKNKMQALEPSNSNFLAESLFLKPISASNKIN